MLGFAEYLEGHAKNKLCCMKWFAVHLLSDKEYFELGVHVPKRHNCDEHHVQELFAYLDWQWRVIILTRSSTMKNYLVNFAAPRHAAVYYSMLHATDLHVFQVLSVIEAYTNFLF